MYLVIDIGNSFVKAYIFNWKKQVFKTDLTRNDLLNDIFFVKLTRSIEINKIIIGASAPSMIDKVVKILKKITNIVPHIITPKNFVSIFDFSRFEIDKIGVDILGFSLFLKRKFNKAIGISFGTANFATGVDNNKMYGAIIWPNKCSIEELVKKTELISCEAISNLVGDDSLNFGHDTQTALIYGNNFVKKGGVPFLIEYFSKQLSVNKFCLTGNNISNKEKDKILRTNLDVCYIPEAISLGYLFLCS